MLRKVSTFSSSFVRRWMPDSFIFCLLLTFLTFLLASLVQKVSPSAILSTWQKGFFSKSILAFTTQMVLILVFGSALAQAAPLKKALARLAGIPQTPRQGIWFIAFCSGILFWFNWGLGLIAGTFIAQTVARKIKKLDYGLALASVYAPMVIWHAGLSGSIPLKIAEQGHFVQNIMGVQPISRTIFDLPNLILSLFFLLTIPFLLAWLHPDKPEVRPTTEAEDTIEPEAKKMPSSPAAKLEQSYALNLLFGIAALLFLGKTFLLDHSSLSLNLVNLSLLTLGILLYPNPIAYSRAVTRACQGIGGIVLQFPFYGGIMGIMSGTGLAETMAHLFTLHSTAKTLPLLTYWSGGIVNLFVPSGGGQWVVQGPVMMKAAQELHASFPRVAMALAWGDAVTNLIQPFWAIPIMALAKVSVRDLFGYTLTVFFYVFLISSLFILFFF